jgi:hypothetical protein
MAKAQDADDVRKFARELGVAPIRAINKWVSDHVDSRLGADLDWRREHNTRVQLLAQVPELEIVQSAIDQSSEEIVEEFTALGQLLGADAASQTFHMQLTDGPEVRGKLAFEVSEEPPVALKRYYQGSFKKMTTISYATEEEKTIYTLMSLEER